MYSIIFHYMWIYKVYQATGPFYQCLHHWTLVKQVSKMFSFSFSVTLNSWNLRFYGTRIIEDTTTIPTTTTTIPTITTTTPTKISNTTHTVTTIPTTTTTSNSNIYYIDIASRSESGSLCAGAVAGIVVGSIIFKIVVL